MGHMNDQPIWPNCTLSSSEGKIVQRQGDLLAVRWVDPSRGARDRRGLPYLNRVLVFSSTLLGASFQISERHSNGQILPVEARGRHQSSVSRRRQSFAGARWESEWRSSVRTMNGGGPMDSTVIARGLRRTRALMSPRRSAPSSPGCPSIPPVVSGERRRSILVLGSFFSCTAVLLFHFW